MEIVSKLLEAAAKPGAMEWLRANIAELEAGRGEIDVLFPGVSRRIGRASLGAGDAAVQSIELAGHRYPVPLAAWRADDAARVLLLLALRQHGAEAALLKANELYFQGDSRERIACLRGISFLADDDRAVPAILDALRVNQGEIFEAALCENPYASVHLPELEFHKAVLKCVFVGLSVERIARLDRRTDAALCQSLLDYVHEREAASRSVAAELWPVIAQHPPPGIAGKLLGYLEHPDAEHRAAAARAIAALVVAGDRRLLSFLRDRCERESNAAVKTVIATELSRCEET